MGAQAPPQPAAAQSWQVALLDELRAPVTPTNLKTLNGWQAGESGNGELATSNNPLNTELGASAFPHLPGTAVPVYPSLAVGVSETAATLEGSGFEGLLADLRAGVTPSAAQFAAWDPGNASYGTSIENDIAGAPATASGLTVSGGVASSGAAASPGLLGSAENAGKAAANFATDGLSGVIIGSGGVSIPSPSGIAGDLAGELGVNPTKWVAEIAGFVKGEAALGLSYILLTLLGLTFVVFGTLELFGYSPKRVAGGLVSKPTKLAEDIPF